MPRVNWDTIEDSTGTTLIPDGDYLCKVKDVVPETGKNDEEVWRLELEVAVGDFAGEILFDRLFFTLKAMPRVKFVCKRLGLDTTGEVTINPQDLIGLKAVVSAVQSEYQAKDGTKRKNMKIPFDGYRPPTSDDYDAIPF